MDTYEKNSFDLMIGLEEEPKTPQISEEEQIIENNRIEIHEKGFEVSPGIPWRRYFARCFDGQIGVTMIAMPFIFIIASIKEDLTMPFGSNWLISLVSYALYIFVEALLIKLTGTTFGKFAMGIKIITSSYNRNYTYLQLVKRGFLVLVKGLAFNIPVANIITMVVAMNYVGDDKSGQASWDFDCGTLVAYKKFEAINYILIVFNVAISVAIIVFGLIF